MCAQVWYYKYPWCFLIFTICFLNLINPGEIFCHKNTDVIFQGFCKIIWFSSESFFWRNTQVNIRKVQLLNIVCITDGWGKFICPEKCYWSTSVLDRDGEVFLKPIVKKELAQFWCLILVYLSIKNQVIMVEKIPISEPQKVSIKKWWSR